MIMRAEKSHNPPSTSWRLEKAGGIVSVQAQRPKNQGHNGVKFSPSPKTQEPGRWCHKLPSLSAGKDQNLSTTKEAEAELFSPLPLCSNKALHDLDRAHLDWGGKSALHSLQIQKLISSGNTLISMPRNNVWPNIWRPHNPVKLILKINLHTDVK